ncbi:serine/threonine-protein kinase MRCK beta [Sinocyclocheilus rhinocerous]|uniref:serine/threonine-protein kinase MRCK beta n=1 Tax=Sinocyclocheilus rhinocerous TaxID=307959 RepID=UPI0007B83228|nr:PREDICTED: serine/threonine-protein kinase MRCK beta-like [Sinocyclocheilus rhinocerous]
MHSGNLEKVGSLRKRTLSRGMSEDESLKHIIRDAEESSRHLSRSDSRYGSLKRGQRQESHSEDDLLSENIEMMELRASYEGCLQEVRTLELQQEAVLFQVDCLQDALEGTEEMLAETQRDNLNLTMELEREREMRRKSEDMLASLKRELERLREERSSEPLQSRPAGPIWLQATPEGTSVDRDEQTLAHSEGTSVDLNVSQLLQLKKAVSQTLSPSVSHSQKPGAQGGDDNDESSGYEDAPSEFSPSPSTPDTQPDGALQDSEAEEGGGGMSDSESGLSKSSDSCALS